MNVNVNGLEEEPQQMNEENVANLPCLNLLTAQGRRVDDWTSKKKQKNLTHSGSSCWRCQRLTVPSAQPSSSLEAPMQTGGQSQRKKIKKKYINIY